MNIPIETIQKQFEHRTIRSFKDEPLPNDIRDALLEVARRTATSNGMQQFSIIHVTDSEKKHKISEICQQGYVARAPELFIFIADQHRNAKIAEEKGVETHFASDMDRFFQAVTDACLAAQNVVNAAESLGLGTMYLGSILNDASAMCELLKLPPLTFPVVGLGVGYPNQEPQLKPRMASEFKVFENEYQSFESYLEVMKPYDDEMQSYYDLRNANKRMDSFTDQVATKYQAVIAKRQDLLNVVFKQGFKSTK